MPVPCNCGQVNPRPSRSSFQEASPYIQLGAFSTETEMEDYFNAKHRTFQYYVPNSQVEFVKLEFVKGLTKSYLNDYCAPFANEYKPADNTQVTNLKPDTIQLGVKYVSNISSKCNIFLK